MKADSAWAKTLGQSRRRTGNVLVRRPPIFQNRFTFKGIEFGIIPDLENMSWGEYIDIETYISDFENIHKAMGALYRPISKTYKDTYEIQKYNADGKYDELMEFCPLDIVLGASVFFCNLEKILLVNTISCLKEMTKTMPTSDKQIFQNKHNLASNGNGIMPFLKSQMETLQSMTPLPSYPLGKSLHSLHIPYKKTKYTTKSAKDKLENQKVKA